MTQQTSDQDSADSGPATPPRKGNSRYQQEHDGAPLRRLDPATIVDATPRYEPIRASGNISPYVVNGKEYVLLDNYRSYKERGIASWYGTKFDGHATSNGETYSLYDMSAAHRTLPIPVYVKVTNLRNGRTAVVRVNDRGPFHSERIMDLSYAAAVKLGFSDQGTAPVEIEIIDTDNTAVVSAAETARYYLQVGAFKQLASATELQRSLSAGLGYPVLIASSNNKRGNDLHRVRVGPFIDYSSAQAAKKALKQRWSGEPHLVVEANDS
ncbi:septal ring lytic transglycosylase RlpA family protein [Zhongshania guokunii]|uniref:Endolytic peptidoglycan transglycosylase RlpA n=1 Tax=Zhongshania guokunii TaxID=641783 RepID=A0ABV3U704_9GAMM